MPLKKKKKTKVRKNKVTKKVTKKTKAKKKTVRKKIGEKFQMS